MSPAEVLNTLGRWLVPLLGQLSLELVVLAGIVMAVLFALRVRSPLTSANRLPINTFAASKTGFTQNGRLPGMREVQQCLKTAAGRAKP